MKGIKVLRQTNKKGVFCSGGVGGSEYFEFQIGKRYKKEGKPKLCQNGFHFFDYKNFCFGYDFYEVGDKQTVYVEIESEGEIDSDTYKNATCDITIVKLIPKKEWSKWMKKGLNSGHRNSGHRNSGDSNSGDRNSGYYNSGNRNSGHYNSGERNSGNSNSGHSNSGDRNSGDSNSGHYNSGHRNSGDSNSGHRNSGDYNSGDRNSGDYNSGDSNSGDYNSGCFNTTHPDKMRVFNNWISYSEWEKIKYPYFLSDLNGKLDREDYLQAWESSQHKGADLERLKAIPGFTWKVWTELTGLTKKDMKI